MTAAEPMSTPYSGGCRCRIIGGSRDPYEPHIPTMPEWEQADDCPVHPLAAHPEPVPTPDSAEPVERACDSDFGYPGTSVHRAHEWDAEVQERAGARWTSETFRCPGVAPDSADDATVGERECCDTCSDTGRVPWMIEGDPNFYQEPDDDEMLPCPDCSATPPADDANRAPVSGGLDEGEREAICICAWTNTGVCPGDAHETRCSQHRAAVERILIARAETAEAERDTARREAGERIALAKAEALREAADAIQAMHPGEVKNSVTFLRDRAARIARADALTSDDGSGA